MLMKQKVRRYLLLVKGLACLLTLNLVLVTAPQARAGNDIIVNPDSKPVPIKPVVSAANNDATSTAATGTNWTALASHPCQQVTIINTTGTKIDVRYGTGTAISLPDATGYTFRGLSNSSGLQVRRNDTSNTQVAVAFNWEKF